MHNSVIEVHTCTSARSYIDQKCAKNTPACAAGAACGSGAENNVNSLKNVYIKNQMRTESQLYRAQYLRVKSVQN